MEPQTPRSFNPAARMMAARMASMALGLLATPILIRYLGGNGYATWAVLWAVGAAFSLIEAGMLIATVRFIATPIANRDWIQVRTELGRIWMIPLASFGAALLPVLLLSERIAALLHLPDLGLFTARQAILFIFAAVALRALLRTGNDCLYAAGRFSEVALVSILQAVLSNLAAMWAAWHYRSLDAALIAFWLTQLAVLAAALFLPVHSCLPRFTRAAFTPRHMRELFGFSVASQLNQWAMFINFQFDKFVVAALVGLWAVAPYDVANRAVAALRSVPASGMQALLPAAVTASGEREDAWRWYTGGTRMAAYFTVVFMLAPLTIAPVFLYAWAGEMGYLGRWVFFALMAGAAANVLVLPALTLAQAGDMAQIQSRSALLSILFNVCLSLTLVLHWRAEGAALGTGIAMLVSSAQLFHAIHVHFDRPLGPTLRLLTDFWPLLLTCAFWGVLTYVVFHFWFAGLGMGVRYSRLTRVMPGMIAMAAYAACVFSLAAVELARGRLSAVERAFLLGLLRPAWLARMLRGRAG